MIDNQLLVGIVLIAAGVAVGLLAYALVLNRRDAAEHQGAGAGAEAEAAEAGEAEQLEPSDEIDLEEEMVEEEASEPLGEPEAPLQAPVTETTALSEEKGSAPGKRYEVATLLRNEESGKLVLMVDDREYASPWELKGTEDWVSVERAARDLVSWLGEAQPSELGQSSRPKKATPPAKSLVDEVNEILERRLAEAGLTQRGVRLSGDREGSVRVYIGIQSYTLDEIPDADIREVIRQAVAEWEGR